MSFHFYPIRRNTTEKNFLNYLYRILVSIRKVLSSTIIFATILLLSCPSLFVTNPVSFAAYAQTPKAIEVSITSHSDPSFVFNLNASSSPTGIVSGSGIGVMNGHIFNGSNGYVSVSFKYSISSLSISKTTNLVNGKVGNTAYITVTVTHSTDTDKVPIGSTFSIIGNDPCCGTDPSIVGSNSKMVIVSFQGPLGGVYSSAGEVNIIS
jgi:hypothetical protein